LFVTAAGDTATDGRSAARVGAGCTLSCLTVVLECERPLAGGFRVVLDGEREIAFGRGGERTYESFGGAGPGAASATFRFPSARMSASHASLAYCEGRFWIHDAGSRNGTFVNGYRVQSQPLAPGDVLEMGRVCLIFEQLFAPEKTGPWEDGAQSPGATNVLRTLLPSLQRDLRDLPRLAASGLSVLVMGETGTGKELVARGLHTCSGDSGAFVAVNCSALPAALVESQLFGHRRGAFSGASHDEPGLVRAAAGGTLFLDEIGDLPLPAQGTLLRVLQEREVLPVGATRPVPVQFRCVAATHRDLRAEVARGAFRADLFARLDGAALVIPPLRARRCDFGQLVAALLARVCRGDAPVPSIDPQAALAMLSYPWPGNVRELEQCIARAAAVTDSAIAIEHLPRAVAAASAGRGPLTETRLAADSSPQIPRPLREALIDALRREGGNVAAVARTFGKAPMQVRRWMDRLNLDPSDYRASTGTTRRH
jgi:DNA-binding NtrC family response regulator